jgi:hypothetical protein
MSHLWPKLWYWQSWFSGGYRERSAVCLFQVLEAVYVTCIYFQVVFDNTLSLYNNCSDMPRQLFPHLGPSQYPYSPSFIFGAKNLYWMYNREKHWSKIHVGCPMNSSQLLQTSKFPRMANAA